MAVLSSRRRAIALLAFISLLTSAPAHAADWYVDAANGSNLNSGASPSQAWRTITHAVASVPNGGVEVIHIAAGRYDAALGEQFPITMSPGQQLIGDAGGEAAQLIGHGEFLSALLQMVTDPAGPTLYDSSTRVERLSLAQARFGIVLWANVGEISASLVDLEITRTANGGLLLGNSPGGAICAPTLTRIRARDNEYTGGSGMTIQGDLSLGREVLAVDCDFSDNYIGVLASNPGALRFERCRLDRCTFLGASIQVEFSGAPLTVPISFNDSSISGNGWFALGVSQSTLSTSGVGMLDMRLKRCTVAGNSGVARVWNPHAFAPFVDMRVDHCITSNDVIEFDNIQNLTVRRSLIASGEFDGVNGCFSGDPQFRDPANGDFRLRFTSPCIDAAFDTPPANALDLDGHGRNLDGDLSTQALSDLGAYEFQPLELRSTGELGSELRLELWGEQGAASTIYWSRTGLVGAASTPFGAFELDPAFARAYRITSVGAFTPTSVVRNIPNAPLLVGHTFAFQALTDSSVAPLSKAFTNGVEVLITP